MSKRSRRILLSVLSVLAACDPGPREASNVEPPSVAPLEVTATAAVRASAAPSPAASSAIASVIPPAPAPRGPAKLEPVEVPNDLVGWMVRAADGKPPRIVFLPGICSNAGAYLMGFPEAARDNGGAVAMDGDKSCGGSKDFRSISSDPVHEEPRILALLAAAGWGAEPPKDLLLVGYSLGATLIENLVKKSPERYSRVLLIGSPRDPRLDRLKGARRVATMSCSLDVPGRMKGAVKMLEGAGIASKYFEMPGCTHGNFAEPERILGEALGWMRASDP